MSALLPATIRRRARATREAGFERLREEGLALVQRISGGIWTDHNLHDPGITVLEQLCFALTELVYRAEFPVADLLTGPDGRIDFAGLALHPPAVAFPCHATTAADQRRRLLDRVPGLDDAWLQPAPQGPAGLLQLRLKLAAHGAESADERVRAALAVCRAERALGEDLDPEVVRVQDRLCELHADIELSGPHEAAEVLAAVFHCAAAVVDRPARRHGAGPAAGGERPADERHDGPLLLHGDAGDPATADGALLYVADITHELLQLPGVKAVHDLWLTLDDGAQERGALPRREGDRALRLHVPGAPGGQATGPDATLHVRLRRRAHELPVDAGELWRRVQDLRAGDLGRRRQEALQRAAEEAERLPRGRHRPPSAYHSVQHHFPPLYGLGVHGVPPSMGAERVARARQLRAYLLLFDQVLANGQAQLAHLHELFSVAGGGRRTYWWQALGERDVPGLEGLLDAPPERLDAEVLAGIDRSAQRKLRLLDHLLALQGEDLPQNAMRLHCGHLSADELDALMLRNKTAWLREVVTLARDRAGAHDDRWPQWAHPGADGGPDPGAGPGAGGDAAVDVEADAAPPGDATSGLARRVALLLGFEHAGARRLTQALAAQRWRLDDTLAPPEPPSARELAASEGVAMPPAEGPAPRGLRPGQALAPALLRAGAGYDRYRLVDAADGATRLVVGPDEHGAWWTVGRFGQRDTARRVAQALRHTLLQVHHDSEGLHVVEHLLLRPLQPGAAADAGFHPLRVSAVFPAWTVRTAQPAFRQLAEETLRINTPAHLLPRALWLDFDTLQRFEDDLAAWQLLRAAWHRGGATAADVDRASARVADTLRAAWEHGA